MMCGSFFIHRARPVPFAFENFQYQVFEVLEPLAEFFAEVVEQSLVSATLPAFLARFELFRGSRHAQLDQSVLVAAHAVTRTMDHVRDVLVWIAQSVAHHPPIIGAGLGLDVFAEVPVELRAVLLLRSV